MQTGCRTRETSFPSYNNNAFRIVDRNTVMHNQGTGIIHSACYRATRETGLIAFVTLQLPVAKGSELRDTTGLLE